MTDSETKPLVEKPQVRLGLGVSVGLEVNQLNVSVHSTKFLDGGETSKARLKLG